MQKRIFLKNMHYLRGVAILCIMVVHLWIPSLHIANSDTIYIEIINGIRETLFHDSTIFFIFISGFLLEYLSSRFSSFTYYIAKFKNIVVPYVFLTILILLLKYFVKGEPFTLLYVIDNILMGKAQSHYWYIPFICIVFLLSPFLLKFFKSISLVVVVVILFLPLLGTRTGIDISLGQYLYFLPIYSLGIICSSHYEKVIVALENKSKWLLVLMGISTVLIISAKTFEWKLGIVDLYESFHYIQKLSILFLLINFFKKYESLNIIILDLLAKYSFALYFTHNLINSLIAQKFYNSFDNSSILLLPFSILYVLFIITVSLVLCIIAKRVLGSKSRFIIGV